MGKSRVGRKEGKCDQTHAEESRRSHMHRSDDTIWSFAPEACDNITATCYVPHGQRHARELLTPTRAVTDSDRYPTFRFVYFRIQTDIRASFEIRCNTIQLWVRIRNPVNKYQ
ncbi:hypothetical protein ALC57_15821 [Trachymyrmex cornetzi]|uniref:Uncharacterized protein n=1 Tax=Trachymyrmex cornetzi TaxID=471704 RepID=A0A151IW64_9HYME|nr:hypothetical protein ALC57_15821 [Trachymyrmex cornetzi]